MDSIEDSLQLLAENMGTIPIEIVRDRVSAMSISLASRLGVPSNLRGLAAKSASTAAIKALRRPPAAGTSGKDLMLRMTRAIEYVLVKEYLSFEVVQITSDLAEQPIAADSFEEQLINEYLKLSVVAMIREGLENQGFSIAVIEEIAQNGIGMAARLLAAEKKERGIVVTLATAERRLRGACEKVAQNLEGHRLSVLSAVYSS